MEYIDGITLKTYIEQQGVVEWREAIHFTAQILKALQHAHEKGIVHRDIKPQNIMLLPDGTIKVTDFGIARFSRSEQRTITDKAIGSVHYISPEQARGDYTDGKADIYSVGVLLYEMITGRVPFQADSAVSVAIMQLQNDPARPCQLNSMLPKGLEDITLKAMQKDPNKRYATAQDMLNDIEVLMQNPNAVFNYNYFVDQSATKPIDRDLHSRKPQANPVEEEKKSHFIPILHCIAMGFLILVACVVVFAVNFFGSSGNVECPTLIGLNINDVLDENSEYSQFDIKVAENGYNYNAEYDKDLIYRQEPEPGEDVKEEGTITVYVSLGSKEFIMKDFVSDYYVDVVNELEDEYGLKVVTEEVPSDEVLKDYVVGTDPTVGETVKTGDTVTVYVSTGERVVQIKVPDVVGYSENDAKKKIEESELTYTVVEEYNSDYAAGYVFNQSPEEGEFITNDKAVTIYVSLGEQVTTTTTTTATPTTTEPPTTTENSHSFVVQLPREDVEVELSIWVGGIKMDSKTVDLGLRTTYPVTVTGADTADVVIKLNSDTYNAQATYRFNTDTNAYELYQDFE